MSIKENVTQLIANGYHLIPIRPNEKRPAISNWQNARLDAGEILKHTAKGCGIGILTGVGDHPVCGVDIDSMDEELVRDLLRWRYVAGIPLRVGQAPKMLAVFETDKSYNKLVSRKFTDTKGNTHQLEILGKGQQFVAFGTHPEGFKYTWGSISPLDFPTRELNVLNYEQLQELVASFEALCLERGYTPKGQAPRATGVMDLVDPDSDDPFAGLKQTVGLSPEECSAILAKLDVDDYDLWLKAGMALHHEFNGSEDGLRIWDAWSVKGGTYAGWDDLEARWQGFGKAAGEPVTMRSLQYHKKEIETAERRAERVALGDEIRSKVAGCADLHTLMDEIAAAVGVLAGYDPALNGIAEVAIKDRFKALSGGAAMGVKDIREALVQGRKAGGGVEKLTKPAWCNGWVFVSEPNHYYNVKDGVTLGIDGFRNEYSDKSPDASKWVLTENLVPKVRRRAYLPGAGPLFKIDGVRYVNTYVGDTLVNLEGEVGPSFEEDSGVFREHITLMVGGGVWTRECQLFVNFLRYIVQNPGKRIPWAVLLQGGEGDGKSEPIRKLMMKLVGRSNTTVISAQTIEGSNFNSWAEGHVFGVIEEIKLHGHNRFDILNSLKAVITNDMIEIHKKGESPVAVPNTGNYYLTTNYKDALPIGEGDRRYMILFSKFPEGRRRDTAYFDRIFKAIEGAESCKAIGQWLCSVDYHKDFKPRGRAPSTQDKTLAIDLAGDDLKHELAEALEASDSPLFGKDYAFAGPLIEFMSFENSKGGRVPTQIIARYLEELNYICVGRHRINGKRPSAYLKKSLADDLSTEKGLALCLKLYETNCLIM